MIPKFYPGDKLAVRNYRRRPPVWEYGEVLEAKTGWRSQNEGRVSYRVQLERRSQSGSRLFLYVGADHVRYDNRNRRTKY